MRKVLAILFGLFLISPASADQTDLRLDLLFEELRTGDAVRAEENIARITEIWETSASDTVNLLYARAQEAQSLGQYDLGLALADHVVGLAPNFAEGYALRGALRLTQSDRPGAIEDFSKALALEPRHFEVRGVLAQILLANGELFDAYEMFQKVLEWNPHDENARRQSRVLRRDIDGQEI